MPSNQPLQDKDLRPTDLKRGQEEAFARDIAWLQAHRGAFVAVPCPACDGHANTPAFTQHDFQFVRCDECATLFMTPRPSEAIMASYYSASENYRFWAAHIFPASEAVRRERIHRPRLARVVELCKRWGVRTGHMIEVGPGFGTFSALARTEGAFERVSVVEPTPELAAACRARGIDTVERRIEDVGDEVGSADVLVAFEVVEHLFAPRNFLRQCRRLLRPGGLLILSAPNGLGFDVTLLGAESPTVDPEHVNLFNPTSLGRLLERSGFDALETSTPGQLDAELVRQVALSGRIDLSRDAFLRRVLIDEWERLGAPFQTFLAENGLSSHMWLAARAVA